MHRPPSSLALSNGWKTGMTCLVMLEQVFNTTQPAGLAGSSVHVPSAQTRSANERLSQSQLALEECANEVCRINSHFICI